MLNALTLFASRSPLMAKAATGEFSWNEVLNRLEFGIIETLIYTILGVVLLSFAFKMKDLLLPGKLSDQLVKDRNMAIAVVTAAYMLGVCIIIAAAIF